MTVSNETKIAFEKLCGKNLTETEVLEYKKLLIQFFSLLIEIDQRNKRGSNGNPNI